MKTIALADCPAPDRPPERHVFALGTVERVCLDASGQITGDMDIQIMAPGVANALLFTATVLATAAPLFQGVPVFIDHATPADYGRAGGRSVRDLAGMILDPRWDPTTGAILGQFRLSNAVPWVRQLIDDFAAYPSVFGLSADIWLRRDDATGSPARVLSIESANSVDIVIRPAAGGRFTPTHKETTMAKRADQPTSDTDAGQLYRVQNAIGEPERVQTAHTDQLPPAGAAPAQATAAAPVDQAQPAPASVPLSEAVELALQATALPDTIRTIIRNMPHSDLAGARATIGQFTTAWAEAQARDAIRGLGTITAVRDPLDRITLAAERLLGNYDTPDHRAAPRLTGIRELYDLLTGDWDRHGVFHADRVTFANATTTTMAEITRNVLNKVMLRNFEARPQWWQPIVTEEHYANLQAPKWINVGGFSDLDTVAEGGAYTEKTWDDYAETASWLKKGNYIGLTLEMIDKDDIGAVKAIPRKLGLAAYRTLSTDIAALFTANGGVGPSLADGERLFDDLAHANLVTSALDATAWQAAVTAMFSQTEYHSGKTLGVRPSYVLVPIELETTAVNLFTTTLEPGRAGNDRAIANVNHSVITVPEWTDANNWAAAAHPLDLETVMVGYRFGNAPELFVSTDPATGSLFTNDEMRIKVRFIYAVGIGNYRGLYKANVL